MSTSFIPWLRVIVRLSLSLLIFFIFSTVIPLFLYLCSPFVVAFLLASVLHTGISRLERRLSWKRQWIVLWVITFVLLVGGAILWVTIPYLWYEIQSFIQLLQGFQPEMINFLEMIAYHTEQVLPIDTGMWLPQFGVWLSGFLASSLEQLGRTVVELPTLMIQFIVFSMATYFFTCDFPLYVAYWKHRTDPSTLWFAGEVKSTVVTAFGGYLKTQAILSFGVFTILFLGFLLIRQPFSFLLAFIIAFLDFIPMIGAGLVLLPWSLFCFFAQDSNKALILFVLWCGTALFRRLLEPKILGEQTGLSPLLSLVSMYVGLQVAGVWGLIFAPVVVLVVLHFFGIRVFQGLLSDLNQIGLDILALFDNSSHNDKNIF